MSRTLSLAARQALTAAETDELFLICLTIGDGYLPAAIRVVNDTLPLDRAAGTFLAFPFEVDLPDDDAETLKNVKLRIDNVDRSIVASLRGIQRVLPVVVEVVRRAEPDVVEAGPFALSLLSATYDALVVEGDLGFEDVLNAKFPADDFSPASHPGLF